MLDPDKIVYGGVTSEPDNYISPTLMTGVTADDLVMQEEIFGPILPILSVDSVQDAIAFIHATYANYLNLNCI